MQRPHILLIEDNNSVREVLTRQLETLGVRVTALADGNNVKRELEKNRFSLVIADLHLPDCSGLDIARFAQAKNCKIVLLSGDTNLPNRPELLRAGFDRILSKPITLAQLDALLKEYDFQPVMPPLAKPSEQAIPHDIMDVLNLVFLREEMGGLDGVSIGMLLRFPDMMRPLLNKIIHFYRTEQWTNLTDAAHSLKGAARSAGADKLAAICERIQEAAENKTVEPSDVTGLPQEFERVEKAIKSLAQIN